ncbi:MAG: hypothetical protein WBA10_10100 [Elainellaceae cyanobacterium]
MKKIFVQSKKSPMRDVPLEAICLITASALMLVLWQAIILRSLPL